MLSALLVESGGDGSEVLDYRAAVIDESRSHDRDVYAPFCDHRGVVVLDAAFVHKFGRATAGCDRRVDGGPERTDVALYIGHERLSSLARDHRHHKHEVEFGKEVHHSVGRRGWVEHAAGLNAGAVKCFD